MNKTLNYYSNNASDLSSRYESANVSDLQNKLLNSFKDKYNILELGCGSGRDAAFMISHGFHVTGLDGSEKMIQSALKLHPELAGNLFAAALPDDLKKLENTFEGVYSIATLMHLKEAQLNLVMRELSNLLKLNGILFFSVSITRNDINKLGFDKKGRFFLMLDEDKWISICRNNGFKEVSITQSKDGLNRDGLTWLTCIFEKVFDTH